MSFRVRCLFVLLVATLAISATARAQDAAPANTERTKPWGPKLEYTTTPGCLDEGSFRDAVATVFHGADPFDASAPDTVRVTFSKISGGYRGTLLYIPPTGDPWPAREQTSVSCSQVFQALVMAATLRVPDPPKAPPPPAPPPEPTPPPSEPPHPAPDPVDLQPPRVAPAPIAEQQIPLVAESPRDPMDVTITLGTALLMTAGLTADVGPALQLAGGVRYDWFSLDLELRGVFPARVVASEQLNPAIPRNPREFDVSQLAAQFVPCAHFATYFAGCGVVGAYMLIAQDRTQGTHYYPGWSIGPRFGVEVPFAQRFAVFGFAEALFAPYGAILEFADVPEQLDSPGIFWSGSIVSGFFGAGVSVKFE